MTKHITRYYGDNGELIRYEMKNRAKRYKKAHFIDTVVMPAIIIVVGVGVLVAWYLINN